MFCSCIILADEGQNGQGQGDSHLFLAVFFNGPQRDSTCSDGMEMGWHPQHPPTEQCAPPTSPNWAVSTSQMGWKNTLTSCSNWPWGPMIVQRCILPMKPRPRMLRAMATSKPWWRSVLGASPAIGFLAFFGGECAVEWSTWLQRGPAKTGSVGS